MCIARKCEELRIRNFKIQIDLNNSDLLELNQCITWHQWKGIDGKAPQKLQIRSTLCAAVNEFLELVEHLSQHRCHANWHRNIFQFTKAHLLLGFVLQVMDFAMNFINRYQDEVQSAYWNGTQTTLHATMNFFKCLRNACNEIIMLALVNITADLKHDSFVSFAAMNMTLKYLVPLQLIIQLKDM